LCATGVVVGPGATLRIDAAAGSVDISATTKQGIVLDEGTLETVNTSRVRRVRVHSSHSGAGTWNGITSRVESDVLGRPLRSAAALKMADTKVTGAGIAFAYGTFAEVARLTLVDTGGSVQPFAEPSDVTGGGFVAEGSPVDLNNVSVSHSGGYGISVDCACKVRIQGVLARNVAGPAVQIRSSPDMVLRKVVVTNSGNEAIAEPAVRLHNVVSSVGPGQSVDQIFGGGNAIDAVLFSGTVTSDLTWRSVTKSRSIRPLGYLAGRDVTMGPGTTLTVPRSTAVKSDGGTITLDGAHLGAIDGNAVFTGVGDDAPGPRTCPGTDTGTGCSSYWGGIVVKGAAATLDIRHAQIRHAGLAVTVRAGPDDNTSVNEQDVVVTDCGGLIWAYAVNLDRSSPTRVHLDGITAACASGADIQGYGAQFSLTNSDLTGIEYPLTLPFGSKTGVVVSTDAWTPRYDPPVVSHVSIKNFSGGGVYLFDRAAASLSCLNVTQNEGGIRLPAPEAGMSIPSVRDSNLVGNRPFPTTFDLDNAGEASTQGVWWGQPAGPVPGQVANPGQLHDSDPAPAPVACAA
jgi:hypothetical protein